jgi:signal transduction histidine kinase
VAARAEDVAASRRRLVDAADDERRRLEVELRAGVEARLRSLAEQLERVPQDGHAARAAQHLARTREELAEVASGLRPRTLVDGLGPALRELVSVSPVPAECSIGVDGVPADLALTAYFVCAEALTNVAKHAPGATARVVVSAAAGTLVVEVVDDGPGGAASVAGGGLHGLRDRVEARGGRLTLTTGRRGTRIVAELPLDHDA